MKTTTQEYGPMLDEFIKRSAKIDILVVRSRQGADVKQELEELRAKQRKTTKILQKLEVSSSNIWGNIGHGG
jgi:hypothetical protein